jgi:hypothetical protein
MFGAAVAARRTARSLDHRSLNLLSARLQIGRTAPLFSCF